MANRRMEFMERVKFALDKSDAKRDAEEFAKELQGIFSGTKIGFDANSLKELGELFNEKLKEFGKKPIVFSDIAISDGALKEITTRFTKAIAEGIEFGVNKGIGKIDIGIDDQIKQLKADRKKLIDEYNQTEKLITHKTKINKTNNVLGENKRLSLTGDLASNTEGFIKNFHEAVKRMDEAKQGTSEYTSAVLEAQEALDNLYALETEWSNKRKSLEQKKIELNKLIWKKDTPENVAKSKNLETEIKQLESLNIEQQINQLRQLKTSLDADAVRLAFGDLSDEFDSITSKLKTIESQIKDIDEQINILENNNKTLKTLDEIEKAYDRILNKKSKTINKTQKENIESAIGYGDTNERTSIGKLANGYQKSEFDGEDWEKQYVWLVKFVKEYEKYKAERQANQKPINPAYQKLYDKLKPKFADAEKSLKNLLIMTNQSQQNTLVQKSSPWFTDLSKYKQVENAQTDITTETEKEVAAQVEISKELEKQNKLLLYRRVEGELDLNRIGNRSNDALYDKQGRPIIQDALAMGYGGYGDGLYGSVASSAEDLIVDDTEGPVSYFSFDASEYNVHVNKTVEQAEALRTFLLSLQKFVGAGSLLDVSELSNIEDLNGEQLFEKAQNIFKDFSMTKEQFYTWLENAKVEAKNIANLFAKGETPSDRHNFGTRFMKELGYGGIVNDTGDAEYDGNAQGSVIFDPNVEKIRKNLTVFNNEQELIKHINENTQARQGNIEVIQKEIIAQENLNATKQKEIQIEQAGSNNTEIINEDAETTAIQRQNEELKENLNLRQMIERADQNGVHGQSVSEVNNTVGDKNSVAGINMQELKNILSTITYNVKIANDDTDKNTNKIALDDSVLKTVLQDVFKDILNPSTEQNDGNTQEPWALESTLQSVKGVLDSINTNTSKIGTAETTTIADSGVLSAIKIAVESINKKIVQGTKVINTNNRKKTEDNNDLSVIKNSEKEGYRNPKKVDTRVKELQGLYEKRGKLLAQNSFTPREETKEEINQLNKQIQLKFKELGLEDEKKSLLKQSLMIRQEDAKQAEIALLNAKKADEVRAQDIKNEKADLRARIKRNKEENRVNASTTSWNTGNKALESLWKIDNKENPLELKSVQDLMAALQALNTVRQRINENLRKGIEISEADSDELRDKTKQVDIHTEAVKKLTKNYTELSGANVKETGRVVDPNADIETQLVNAVKALPGVQARIGTFDAATNRLKYTVKTGAYTFKEYEMAVRDVGGAIVSVQGETKRAETFFEGFKRKFGEIARYFSASSLIFKAFNKIRKGIGYIREIDSALTELKKVTNETEETYDKFLDTAAKTADKVGSTIKDVISSTADWARLGYSMKEAAQLAESTQILMNVSEFTNISDATDSLISSIQAFKYTAEESMDVVDILNTIGNNYAISTADLAKSLTKSSGALVSANNTLEEAVALTAAANTIIQDADVVGTALKTASMRIRGTSIKEMEEEGLDTDGAVTQSKLRNQIKAISGVDILTDTGAYKSTYQILSEISEVWDNITDDKARAGLLELLAGKRSGSVISSILENPDILKDAFEDASNAEGSALKENEKYLDSIQGRIDIFNNSVQTMWTNTLDSDAVKWFVDFGTKIIKLIDKIGLLRVVLAGLIMYITKKHNINLAKLILGPKDSNIILKGLTKIKNGLSKIPKLFKKIKESADDAKNSVQPTSWYNTKLTEVVDIEALGGNTIVAQQIDEINNAIKQGEPALNTYMTTTDGVSDAMKAYVASLNGGKASLSGFNAFLQANNISLATTKTVSLGARIGIMALNAALSMGLAIIIQFVIEGITKLIQSLKKLANPTIKYQETLSNLTSEISSLESEIDSLNSELETMQERMTELLALPSLSFTEQEELENLKAQSKELERQIKLKETLAEEKNEKATKTAEKLIKSAWYSQGDWAKGMYGGVQKDDFWSDSEKTTKILDESMDYYIRFKELEDSASGRAKKTISKWAENSSKGIRKILDKQHKYINEYNLEYGQSDYIDKYLDEVYAYEYKYQNARGSITTSEMIGNILDDETNEGIALLKEKMSEIMGDKELTDTEKQVKAQEIIQEALNNTSGAYDRLQNSMNIIGISAEQLTRYFTQVSKAVDSNTIEGVTAQYAKGVDALKQYHGSAEDILGTFTDISTGKIESITWGSLFDEDGEVVDTQISKLLQGADETVRKEFSRLAKSVNEGKISVEQAMNAFGAAGMVASWKLVETQISELNADVFKDLGDEISGIINTVSELSSAFESVADSIDLVNQAQAEMAYSGHLSVETALQLMESTDDWNELLKIEEGNIKLVDGAEQVLVQTKLDLIKTNLQTALSTVEAQLAQIDATSTNMDAATTIEQSTNVAVRELAANMAYAAKMAEAYTRAMNGEDINIDEYMQDAETAKQNVLDKTNYQKNAANAIGREELEKEKARLQAMLGMYETVDTIGEFEDNYSSDKVSGGSDTKEDAENNQFQKAMDYWENRISANQAKYEQIQNEIDLLEAKGMRAGEEYYRKQIKYENERKSYLKSQKAEATTYLATLKEGSDEWWEVASTINDIESELDDVIANVQELNDAIGQIRWDGFEKLHDRFSNLKNDLENIRDILSNEDMFDDEGNWTKEGVTTLAAHIYDIQLDKNALANVQEELTDFQKGYEGNEDYFATIGIDSEQEYYDKLVELTDKQDDYVKQIKDSEQSVVEMYENQIDAIEEYIGELIEGYNDYIDVVKESLDAERDLYEFKKNIQKQTKDIASLERRIASLSGSNNAADIAERRKLEAELYDAKEGLNDTYYERSKDQQSQALDDEAQAYEESMNKYIEGLHTMLEEATENMTTFLSEVTNAVIQNASSIVDTLEGTGLALDSAIVDPFTKAAEAMEGFEDNALSRMNSWTKAGADGYFYNFDVNATNQLESPWSAGTTAANTFATNVKTAMGEVYKSIQSNVDNSLSKLNSLASGIKDTNVKASSSDGDSSANNTNSGTTNTDSGSVKALQEVLNTVFNAGLTVDGKLGPATTNALKKAQAKIGISADGKYGSQTRNAILTYIDKQIASWRASAGSSSAVGQGIQAYNEARKKLPIQLAKGTMGLNKDQFAITDEPWLGDELVLIPTKSGNLSYMRAGSTVIPADITANLVEWGKLNPDILKAGSGVNINMINNAVTKPEFNFDIAEFLHVDHVDKDAMPELEKFVDKKINDLVRQMNYSIKKFK